MVDVGRIPLDVSVWIDGSMYRLGLQRRRAPVLAGMEREKRQTTPQDDKKTTGPGRQLHCGGVASAFKEVVEGLGGPMAGRTSRAHARARGLAPRN